MPEGIEIERNGEKQLLEVDIVICAGQVPQREHDALEAAGQSVHLVVALTLRPSWMQARYSSGNRVGSEI